MIWMECLAGADFGLCRPSCQDTLTSKCKIIFPSSLRTYVSFHCCIDFTLHLQTLAPYFKKPQVPEPRLPPNTHFHRSKGEARCELCSSVTTKQSPDYNKSQKKSTPEQDDQQVEIPTNWLTTSYRIPSPVIHGTSSASFCLPSGVV